MRVLAAELLEEIERLIKELNDELEREVEELREYARYLRAVLEELKKGGSIG